MKPKIFIDPGHGGTDPGSAAFGLQEKDLNLMVARELSKLLSSTAYQIMLSRSTDLTISLKARTDKAKAWDADIFISIHHNAFSNPAANGYELFYQLYRPDMKDESFRLAVKINEELGNTFFPDLHPRGVKHKQNSNGGEWYHILRETDCPAVIIECGFLTSPSDIATLKSPDFPVRQAVAIGKAVDSFFYNELVTGLHPEGKTKETFINDLKILINSYEGII